MGNEKRTYIIAIIASILFGVIFVGFIISKISLPTNSQNDTVQSENNQDSEEKISDLYEKTNLNDLETQIAQPHYIDKRSGFAFHYPDSYKVNVHDEYLTLSSPKKNCGVIMLFNPEYEATDGFYVFEDTQGIKNRLDYDIGLRTVKTISYDPPENVENEVIEGHKSKTEKDDVILIKNGDQSKLSATFYNFVLEDKSSCVGYYTYEGASPAEKEDAKNAALEVMKSLSLLTYSEAQSHEELSFKYDYCDIGTHRFPYPVAWNVYEKNIDGKTFIIKPPTINRERFQGCAIVYSEMSPETYSDGSINLTPALYLEKLKSTFGDACSLNPEINNDKTTEYFQGNVSEAVFNGYKYKSSFPEMSIAPENYKVYSTSPIIDRNAYCYYMIDNNKVIVLSFIYRKGYNESDMEFLSQYILNHAR